MQRDTAKPVAPWEPRIGVSDAQGRELVGPALKTERREPGDGETHHKPSPTDSLETLTVW